MPDEWISRLKAAFDAGYYKTEAGEGQQTLIPWKPEALTHSMMSRLLAVLGGWVSDCWNHNPVSCSQCGRLFSTMTQGLRRRQRVRCCECYRAHVLRQPTLMATYARVPPSP